MHQNIKKWSFVHYVSLGEVAGAASFCLPGAGAAASNECCFATLVNYLSPKVAFFKNVSNVFLLEISQSLGFGDNVSALSIRNGKHCR
jgi:hypothetical protein